MAARLNPYLNFRDDARAAMEFYQSVFGGELTLNTFEGMSDMGVGADEVHKIMHGMLEAPNGFTLMGADTPNSIDRTVGSNFSISLSGGPESDAELRSYWDKLADGASNTMGLDTAPWGDTFGMLTDKFGIAWLVNIAGK